MQNDQNHDFSRLRENIMHFLVVLLSVNSLRNGHCPVAQAEQNSYHYCNDGDQTRNQCVGSPAADQSGNEDKRCCYQSDEPNAGEHIA
jgi:hypothetical protein